MAATKKNTSTAAEPVVKTEPVAPQTEPVAPPQTEPEVKTAELVEAAAIDGGSPVAVAVTSTTDELSARIAAALEKQVAILNAAKDLIVFFKALQKDVAKLQKRDGRKQRKQQAAQVNGEARKLSGFAKPTAMSEELCDFLGVAKDTMLARTEVTRLLNKYVKDNGLQDSVDKRRICPDGKLQKVLALQGDAQLTYFNLQSHIKHHFVKTEPAVAAAVVVAST